LGCQEITMKRTLWTTVAIAMLLGLLAGGTLFGQLGLRGTKQPEKPADANADAPAKPLVKVDAKKKTVSFPAEICGRMGMDGKPMQLELLLTSWKGKTHESILRTKAKGWQIHAGLVMLGLPRGRPAETTYSIDTDTYTSQPPRGPKVTIRLSWTDAKGETHTAEPANWMQAADPNVPATPPSDWVFTGSILGSSGGYAADGEGVFITVSNFATAIIDVPFVSTDSDASLYFVTRPNAIPPLGTDVTVTIEPKPKATKSKYARRLLYVDRFGRYRAEGKDRLLALDDLTEWGRSFVGKHDRGQVVLRAAGKAYIHDVLAAREELWIGGIREIDVQYDAARWPVLPRTPGQMKAALKDWEEKFAQPHEQIDPPLETVVPTLEQIDQKLHEMKVTRKMLEEYRAKLEAMATKAKTSSTDKDQQ
jgi:hypothetical protein